MEKLINYFVNKMKLTTKARTCNKGQVKGRSKGQIIVFDKVRGHQHHNEEENNMVLWGIAFGELLIWND